MDLLLLFQDINVSRRVCFVHVFLHGINDRAYTIKTCRVKHSFLYEGLIQNNHHGSLNPIPPACMKTEGAKVTTRGHV